ncbi:MAG: flavodoxin domain-containing protein [Acidimicrobiia bacterium]|nr:flavodoxin domain-containing protein [Acidimicrobiia bacterium]
MRLLVAYGSKMGGTKGLAEMLGDDFRDLGHDVEVRSGDDVADVSSFDAVVVGGALYYFISWHKDAKAVLRRHHKALREMPVWLFSSGPLDESATEKEIPPIRPVMRAMERVGARGHITFGGRLEESNRGLPVGDWRKPEHVRKWAEQIHAELVADGA